MNYKNILAKLPETVILALDNVNNLEVAIGLVKQLGPRLYAVKIHNLMDRLGPDVIRELKQAGAKRVWVDYKIHDIPATAGHRCKDLNADIVTVHAGGGVEMMEKAVSSTSEIFAVTVLTSLSGNEVVEIYNRQTDEEVLVLALMAKRAGVKTLVCSAEQVGFLSTWPELTDMKFAVPGIRQTKEETHDQKAVGTPRQAILGGATYLVVGRPLTDDSDPSAVLNSILEEVQGALNELPEEKPVYVPAVFSIERLSNIRRIHFGPEITNEGFDHVFKMAEALWLHSGNPSAPHVILTAGNHSDGFVNTLKVLIYTNLCQLFAKEMAKKYREYARENGLPESPDWVVGSDHAGATFSYAFAFELGSRHDFTEKAGSDGKLQEWKRFTIAENETVLQVEELITTTSTLQRVRNGIIAAHEYEINFLPVVLTLVHRSTANEFLGDPILHLRHYDIATWTPDECPLCTGGSEAITAKKNWKQLTENPEKVTG